MSFLSSVPYAWYVSHPSLFYSFHLLPFLLPIFLHLSIHSWVSLFLSLPFLLSFLLSLPHSHTYPKYYTSCLALLSVLSPYSLGWWATRRSRCSPSCPRRKTTARRSPAALTTPTSRDRASSPRPSCKSPVSIPRQPISQGGNQFPSRSHASITTLIFTCIYLCLRVPASLIAS